MTETIRLSPAAVKQLTDASRIAVSTAHYPLEDQEAMENEWLSFFESEARRCYEGGSNESSAVAQALSLCGSHSALASVITRPPWERFLFYAENQSVRYIFIVAMLTLHAAEPILTKNSVRMPLWFSIAVLIPLLWTRTAKIYLYDYPLAKVIDAPLGHLISAVFGLMLSIATVGYSVISTPLFSLEAPVNQDAMLLRPLLSCLDLVLQPFALLCLFVELKIVRPQSIKSAIYRLADRFLHWIP